MNERNEKIMRDLNDKLRKENQMLNEQKNKKDTITASFNQPINYSFPIGMPTDSYDKPVTYKDYQKFIGSDSNRPKKKICKKITRVYYNNNLIDMYDCLCYAVPAFEEKDSFRSYTNWEDFVWHYGKSVNARSCKVYLKGMYDWIMVWKRKFWSWKVTVEYRSVGSSVNRYRSCDDKDKVSMQRILNELSEEEFVEYWKDNFDQTTRFLSQGGNE